VLPSLEWVEGGLFIFRKRNECGVLKKTVKNTVLKTVKPTIQTKQRRAEPSCGAVRYGLAGRGVEVSF
jgi:hypothetical protein